jgi:hypothetical protein
VFSKSHVTIKSGEGKSYFEASAELDSMADTSIIMANLRHMQRERMEWAEKQTAQDAKCAKS